MHHSVFVLKQLSYLREGGMAHRWARRRPASVSVATGTSHPAVPDFRPAGCCCHRFPACCLTACLLLASFSTTFTCGSVTLAGLVWCDCEKELLWPTLICASLRSEKAKVVRRGGSVLSATSSDCCCRCYPERQVRLPLGRGYFHPALVSSDEKNFKMISSTSFLTFLPTIFLACCATAVDKCGEGQVADHQIIRTSDHQNIRTSDHQNIRSSDHQFCLQENP